MASAPGWVDALAEKTDQSPMVPNAGTSSDLRGGSPELWETKRIQVRSVSWSGGDAGLKVARYGVEDGAFGVLRERILDRWRTSEQPWLCAIHRAETQGRKRTSSNEGRSGASDRCAMPRRVRHGRRSRAIDPANGSP
jgi:hypothetical protein